MAAMNASSLTITVRQESSSHPLASCSLATGQRTLSSRVRVAQLRPSHFLGCTVRVNQNSTCQRTRHHRAVHVSAVLDPSELGGSMHEDFDECDKEYVRASILQATEVKSGSDGFLVKLIDGSVLRCSHNATNSMNLPDYAAQPAIVLKLEDGSNVLLPLIVLEQPRALLLEAMKNVTLARPTVYQVIRDMIELMGYELRMVRVTHRMCEAYYARAYLSRVGSESHPVISLDLRPSDAINLAVRSKAPIQVNRALAVNDGVRQVSMVPRGGAMRSLRALRSYNFTWTELDRPDVADAVTTQEFAMIQLMEVAAREERFHDAAKIRDQLKVFREGASKPQGL